MHLHIIISHSTVYPRSVNLPSGQSLLVITNGVFMCRPVKKNQLILIRIESIPNFYSSLDGFKINFRLRGKASENKRYSV